MSAAFLAPGDPRWTRALEALPHDVYHRPEYVACLARHEGGRPAAFLAETGRATLLVPLVAREPPPELGAPSDWSDLSTPYGYGSPVVSPGASAAAVREALLELRRSAAASGAVTAFLRLHPLLPFPREALDGLGTLVRHGATVLIDLALPAERCRAAMRSGHREEIQRLRRDGYRVAMDDWSHFGAFRELYAETMARLGAEEFYRFSDAHFVALRESLGERLHLGSVLAPDGRVAAAALFTETDGIVQYHLSGTAEAHRRRAPTKLLLDAAAEWARDRGDRVLHLGGGVGGREDGVFAFKAGFSALRGEFHTCRMVLDAARYEVLRRSRTRLRGLTGAAPDFFPAYRGR
ncbi:MAG TPA: GNAT family N-acetyltransferase [Longimicrobiales bacterium]|nr:GNAT family N-acetyltransferase [Longimicrobiales bacterium]